MAGVVNILKVDSKDISPDKNEALRYMGSRGREVSAEAMGVMEDVAKTADSAIRPRVCYLRVPVDIKTEEVDFSVITLRSAALARLLKDCRYAYLFAATCGSELDRLIARQSATSVARGAMCDAYGSAAIEAVCDYACDSFERMEGAELTHRFSPGYSDLSIEVQPDFLRVLDANRRIGLTITDGMMMVPVKSVTAIVGVRGDGASSCDDAGSGCSGCDAVDCIMRKE
ncbi:MAG: hypothetical protein K5840_08145 [Eubacterium sp.]|nr:hypothetical protein [Eubacterium sp.]